MWGKKAGRGIQTEGCPSGLPNAVIRCVSGNGSSSASRKRQAISQLASHHSGSSYQPDTSDGLCRKPLLVPRGNEKSELPLTSFSSALTGVDFVPCRGLSTSAHPGLPNQGDALQIRDPGYCSDNGRQMLDRASSACQFSMLNAHVRVALQYASRVMRLEAF